MGPNSSTNNLSKNRALVLDCAYRPINVVSWPKAVMMDFTQKVWGMVTSASDLKRIPLDVTHEPIPPTIEFLLGVNMGGDWGTKSNQNLEHNNIIKNHGVCLAAEVERE